MVFARIELVLPYSLSLPPWVEMEPAADSLPPPAGPVLLICRSEGILWRSCHCGWRRERLSSQPVGTRKMTSVSRIKKFEKVPVAAVAEAVVFAVVVSSVSVALLPPPHRPPPPLLPQNPPPTQTCIRTRTADSLLPSR